MVNRFLRTAPIRTLLGAIAGFMIVIAGGAAIAVAASSGGPVPRPEPLAKAVHGAVDAPPVKGVTADVTFINRLLGTSELQGTDPLLQGGSGQLWVSNDGQFRLELHGDNGDPEIVVTHRSWWISDPALQTVYQGTLPARRAGAAKPYSGGLPTMTQIQADINQLAQHFHLSGAVPSDVGGQPAYTVTASPKQAGGLVGKLALAWDAVQGVPLEFAVYARNDPSPVLELAATNVSYGPITGVFDLTPPSGYHVVHVAMPSQAASPGDSSSTSKHHAEKAKITGVKAVAKHLPFKLVAPRALAGLSRKSVSLIGKDGALLVYGEGLGAIAVTERRATASSSQQLQLSRSNGDHQRGIMLPTFSVGGATAQELDTALGTLVRFTAHGVSYTVIGSVKPGIARSAARGL